MRYSFRRFTIRALLLSMLLVALLAAFATQRIRATQRELVEFNQFIPANAVELSWGGKAPPSNDTVIGVQGYAAGGGAFAAKLRPESDWMWPIGQLFGVNLTSTHIVELELKNGFDDAHLQQICKLPSVEELSLQNTDCTDVGLLALAGHPKLGQLTIGDGNSFSDAAIAELSASRPDIRVHFYSAP